MSKYHARKTEVDGIKFDSRAEAKRYGELYLLQVGGHITNLKLQPSFVLIDAFVDNTGEKENKVTYKADFMYDMNGQTIVEDVKGVITREYRVKRKLFKLKFGQQYVFKEITNKRR